MRYRGPAVTENMLNLLVALDIIDDDWSVGNLFDYVDKVLTMKSLSEPIASGGPPDRSGGES